MSGAQANTAKVSIAGMKTRIGGRLNSLASAAVRLQHLFLDQLDRVGDRLQQTEGPNRFGPRRTWMRPMMRRSSQTLTSEPADEGEDADRADERAMTT